MVVVSLREAAFCARERSTNVPFPETITNRPDAKTGTGRVAN
jgi:hypothetical protein